ncbi:MAG: toll/interleukin-1 receptor domain-containing protein, partial [Anaerolineae bacterium]|nr:toll/interleukin-1 receptor domain-containing protein [Anaerolineae bacterium]
MDPSGGTPDESKTAVQLTASTSAEHGRQIFVSYSRSDRIAVDQLARDLRARHHELWMDVDERGIEPGEDWQEELVEQMNRSVAVVACVSPDFLRSKYCRAEIDQAQRENKPIYPAIVRRLDSGQSLADMNLGHLQYVDLTQAYPQG